MSYDVLGTEIGNYTILQQIGEGGNGVVYRARHTKTKQIVAIKVLLDLKAAASGASRFFEEARAIRQINHPNIVEIYELQTLPDGRPYLVMEFLQGENLEKYLAQKQRLPAVEALEICIPVAEALDAAHQKGIVHRDLKPDNIFLVSSIDKKKKIKLLDFGIAKLHGPEGARRITQSGILLGTPHYMSPEQANQPKNVDGRSDLYALGVILYEMVTGKLPFDSETPIAVLFLHFDRAPTPPSKHVPGLSSKLESLILRCLSKTPAGRPVNAKTFLQECKDILSFERVEALKKTKATPLNDPLQKAINSLKPALQKDPDEDEATSVGPAIEELEEILELDEAIELGNSFDQAKQAREILGRILPDLDPNKTTEDGVVAFSREGNNALIRGSQELTQPRTSQDLAKLSQRATEQKSGESKAVKIPETKPAPVRMTVRPSAFKPSIEPSKTKPASTPIETKSAIPRPNKALTKTQKSTEPPAFLTEEDIATSQKNPGPKTIQTFATAEDPPSPRTILMTPTEEAIRLRLKISPKDAKIVFWINDAAHTPEETPEDIFAAKKSLVEIAVVARGFLPKQVTILATKDTEVAIALERPGPRAPAMKPTSTPSGSKR